MDYVSHNALACCNRRAPSAQAQAQEAVQGEAPRIVRNVGSGGSPDLHLENFSVSNGGPDLIENASLLLASGRRYGGDNHSSVLVNLHEIPSTPWRIWDELDRILHDCKFVTEGSCITRGRNLALGSDGWAPSPEGLVWFYEGSDGHKYPSIPVGCQGAAVQATQWWSTST